MLVLQGNPLNQIPLGPAVFSTVWRFPQIREYKVQSSCKVTVLAPKMANWQYTHPLSIHVKPPFSLQKWKIGNTPMPLPINVKSALALKMANWQYTHAVTNSWKVCTRSENGKLTIHSCHYQSWYTTDYTPTNAGRVIKLPSQRTARDRRLQVGMVWEQG